MNRQKTAVAVPLQATAKNNGMSGARKYLRYLNVFGIFSKENLVSVMPYIFFLTVIALLYIANSYQAERTIREIDGINKELKTLRTEYVTGKSELMFVSKQTEVARKVGLRGIKESVEAPMKIIVHQKPSSKK